MTDRPILFSAPMVRALLDGRKTQTRRVLKLPEAPENLGGWEASKIGGAGVTDSKGAPVEERPCAWHTRTGAVVVPRFAVGDRLWVRESGVLIPAVPGGAGDLFRHDVPVILERGRYWSRNLLGPGAEYLVAGCSRVSALASPKNKVRPSIHMPRWASRLTLIVTDVRVEPLILCSKADAIAEGIHQWLHYPAEGEPYQAFKAFGREAAQRDPRLAYRDLWNSINGAGAWEANPWVVAVTFTVEQRNIDA